MKRYRLTILFTALLLSFCLLASTAVAQTVNYTHGLHATAMEMGFDLEKIYEGLPRFPLQWEENTLIIKDGSLYKSIFVDTVDWQRVEGEYVNDEWHYEANPDEIDKITLFTHEGERIVCYANGLILPDGYGDYSVDDIRIRLEGGQQGYDSARWTFYLPDDSAALYDSVRFDPNGGAISLYTYTAQEPVEIDGELYRVHLEYLPYQFSLTSTVENGELRADLQKTAGSTLSMMWLEKDGKSVYRYSLETWHPTDVPEPAPFASLSREELMQLYPPLPPETDE